MEAARPRGTQQGVRAPVWPHRFCPVIYFHTKMGLLLTESLAWSGVSRLQTRGHTQPAACFCKMVYFCFTGTATSPPDTWRLWLPRAPVAWLNSCRFPVVNSLLLKDLKWVLPPALLPGRQVARGGPSPDPDTVAATRCGRDVLPQKSSWGCGVPSVAV